MEGKKKSVKYEIPNLDYRSITEFAGQNRALIYNSIIVLKVKGDSGKDIRDFANFSTLSGRQWRDFMKLCDFSQTENMFTLGEIIEYCQLPPVK